MSVDYIDALELHALLQTAVPSVSIVDVRDDDRTNWIVGSIWYPSLSHNDKAWATLAQKVKDSQIVVFHCMFSQVRGPKAATTFARMYQTKGQRVCVLRGGFVNFQHLVGKTNPASLHHYSSDEDTM